VSDSPTIGVAAIAAPVRTLGPGRRAVLWVQGCDLRCRGCTSPEWLAAEGGDPFTVDALRERLLAQIDAHDLDGLTISGGEPTLQAAALLALWRRLRAARPHLDLIVYTGHRIEDAVGAAAELLDAADAVIDGPYKQELDDGRGLRGSSNQRVHLRRADWEAWPWHDAERRVELRVIGDSVLVAGVPPAGLHRAIGLASRAVAIGR
jgi:anaerobic ribonucleoside-triphosphate reductase activating protein